MNTVAYIVETDVGYESLPMDTLEAARNYGILCGGGFKVYTVTLVATDKKLVFEHKEEDPDDQAHS